MANYDKKEVERIFRERDEMTEKEAKLNVDLLQGEVSAILDEGGNYDEIEELFLDYGLEMDYIMDFLL